MSDPFAETRPPWWRRRREKRKQHTPKRVAFFAAVLGGATTWVFGSGHPFLVGFAAAALSVVPAVLVEAWYRRRDQRKSERLFSLPDYQPIGASAAEQRAR